MVIVDMSGFGTFERCIQRLHYVLNVVKEAARRWLGLVKSTLTLSYCLAPPAMVDRDESKECESNLSAAELDDHLWLSLTSFSHRNLRRESIRVSLRCAVEVREFADWM